MADLYVRAVPGRLVTRFGSGQFIGATRPFPHPTAAELDAGAAPLLWDTKAVTLIPDKERAKFWREYESAIRQGDLTEATADEYAAYLESQDPQPAPKAATPKGK